VAKKGQPLGDAIAPATASIAPVTGRSHPRHALWDRPVTPKQLAHFLQVSPRTVARLVKKRKLPKIVIGGQTRFIPNDVLDHLRRR